MNRNRANILPKYRESLLTGQSSRPSRLPWSFSVTKVLLIANTPAKEKATHNVPGAKRSTVSAVMLRAKLKYHNNHHAKDKRGNHYLAIAQL